MFGRLPAAFQPIVDHDPDGEGFCIVRRGRVNASSRQHSATFTRSETESCRQPTEYDDLDDEGHASIAASVVALVKSILGIGLVSMPYICSEVGIVPYLLFLAAFTIPSHFANLCLAHSVELVLGPYNGVGPRLLERADYLTLGVLSFGSKAQWAILGLFLLVIWGGTVSLFIALWDILGGYVDDVSFIGSSAVFVPLMGICVFPLCCLDTLHALRHTSYLGIFGIACLAASLGYWSGKSGHNISELETFDMKTSGIALLPVFVFSYMGQFNFIRVYCELKRRSPERVATVSSISLGVSCLFYGVVGVLGYWAFTDDTKQDIFKSYDGLSGVMTHGAKVAYAFSLIFTAPVYLFEARNMVEDICSALLDQKEKEKLIQDDDEEDETKLVTTRNFGRRLIIVFGLLSSMCLMAVVYPHVVQVLGILGATTSTTMMMILPPAFLLRISRFTKIPLTWRMHMACKTFVVIGFFSIPFFLALVIWQLVDPSDSGSSSSGSDQIINITSSY